MAFIVDVFFIFIFLNPSKSKWAPLSCPSLQVFSAMQSNDLGCTYSGGPDPASVLTEAGLSFFTHSQEKSIQSMAHENICIFSLKTICLDVADMDDDMKDQRSSFASSD